MTDPWLDDGDVRLFHGDALERLRELPDESVHCIVTSPPFWGLRDYGTGSWEGGDPECSHAVMKAGRYERALATSTLGGGKKTVGHVQNGFGPVCGRCGARRVDEQIGLEETPDEWCERLVEVFRECRRVLRTDGCFWLEVGDTYAAQGGGKTEGQYEEKRVPGTTWQPARTPPSGLKPKDLVGAPWMLAFALRADGWWLRADDIWWKRNAMPESVTDRPTRDHSYVFLLTKSAQYAYDMEAVREPHSPDGRKMTGVVGGPGSAQHRNGERWPGGGRNMRTVWDIPTESTEFEHFAVMAQALAERCIKAGTSERGCCEACGAPWQRVVEREGESVEQRMARATKVMPDGTLAPRSDGGLTQHAAGSLLATPRPVGAVTWEPTCQHAAGVVPCTVLDPFAGSGTTALVARRLGRRSVGVELSEESLRIAAKRLQQLSLFA